MEKVVDARIESHLIENNLHEPHQSAYRKYHSTESALLKVQNDILQSLDNNCVTVLVLLDLSAAFDTIDHHTLLCRLEDHNGVSGNAISWISSYLSDRHQTVCVEGELSQPVLMKYSVPQGSVLGPKYFTMYTKPVGGNCRRHGLLNHFYADDSQLYIAFKPLNNTCKSEALHRIERCLSEIITWMNDNMLKLNADKTEVMVFSSKNNLKHVDNLTIDVGSATIVPTDCVRNLGAYFTPQMDMDKHVNTVCKSAYFILRNIGRIRKFLTMDATRTLVNSLVTSKLDYCNSLLVGISSSNLNKLQRAQNTAARIILRTSRYDHITPVLEELHWLPICQRIKYKVLVYTYKALNGQCPQYLTDLLNVYRPTRALRSSNDLSLVVPRTRTVTFGNRSFSHAAPFLWNALPDAIRSSSSLDIFRKHLKTHLFLDNYGN